MAWDLNLLRHAVTLPDGPNADQPVALFAYPEQARAFVERNFDGRGRMRLVADLPDIDFAPAREERLAKELAKRTADVVALLALNEGMKHRVESMENAYRNLCDDASRLREHLARGERLKGGEHDA